MSYATLMVVLELGAPNEGLLKFTADLAERFTADVIGIATCRPIQIIYGDPYMSGDLIQRDFADIERETRNTEAQFHAAFQDRERNNEWRSTVTFTSLADFIAPQARAADLLITGPDRGGSPLDSARHVNLGDLVMRVGRPVLIVPSGADKLDLKSVVVGWKDTRETRRAIVDALPLLKKSGRVTLVEIAGEADLIAAREHLSGVADWLKRHDIVAETLAAPSVGYDAPRLATIAHERGAGLLVAGAYGHNRLREWVLGGVTRDLLLRPGVCSLVSH